MTFMPYDSFAISLPNLLSTWSNDGRSTTVCKLIYLVQMGVEEGLGGRPATTYAAPGTSPIHPLAVYSPAKIPAELTQVLNRCFSSFLGG